MWGQHHKTLLNSSSESSHKEGVINNCRSIVLSQDMHVTVEEVCSAIKCSKSGKAPDHHVITSEHIKFGSNNIPVLLSLLFTMIFIHGYLPEGFMLSSIVPLVKNKPGDITSKDNYRPVAINSVISKLFEIVILNRYSHFLLNNNNQFGFKAKS